MELEPLGPTPVVELLAHDFLIDPYMGVCHLVFRQQAGADQHPDLLTFWDCNGRGHVYSIRDVVDAYRPTSRNIKADSERVWPDADELESWLARAADDLARAQTEQGA